MKQKKNNPKAACEIDMQIGMRIRRRREDLQLSQRDLAQAIEVTFQQIQKYERGINRVSVSRLLEISEFLCAPISYFLVLDSSDFHEITLPLTWDKDLRDLIRVYSSLRSDAKKRELLTVAKQISENI